MRHFFKSVRFRVFAFVICALLVGIIVAVATENPSSPVTSAVGSVVAPLRSAASAVAEKLNWFSDSFASAGAYKNENERLREKVAEYESRLAGYDEAMHKLESYETILEVKEENPDFTLVPADIIGSDSSDIFSSIIINKGSSDDVKVNDPVIYGNYLVGVVKKVNHSYSVVESILNPSVNISAIESKTREFAYVTTDVEQSEEGKCILAGLERTTGISPGGIVLTSGIGGIYPQGIIIGTVSQVLKSDIDISSYAIITPGVDIRSLEDVFVITSFDGQGVETIE
ncbi:MAG: rod shape-determining protein MreC [Acutalibacteraceae bacterium]